MTKTKIEWADRVWNPTTGCTKVSAGCKHCYAERIAGRFWGERKFTDVQLHPERLDMPLHWSKPSRVFVNSMSDLFHPDVDEKFIAKVFGIMWLATKHTFMVLTKRPDRMVELLNNEDFQMHTGWFASQAIRELGLQKPKDLPAWPNSNIWLGVSVEDQAAADERIPLLLQTPAAVRFISAEPLLGLVDVSPYLVYNNHEGESGNEQSTERGNFTSTGCVGRMENRRPGPYMEKPEADRAPNRRVSPGSKNDPWYSVDDRGTQAPLLPLQGQDTSWHDDKSPEWDKDRQQTGESGNSDLFGEFETRFSTGPGGRNGTEESAREIKRSAGGSDQNSILPGRNNTDGFSERIRSGIPDNLQNREGKREEKSVRDNDGLHDQAQASEQEKGKGRKICLVICGGESGPNARPMHPDWARSLRDQCVAAGVPFFFKQWGEWHFDPQYGHPKSRVYMDSAGKIFEYRGTDQEYRLGRLAFDRVGKRAAGRLLDGREWNQFPEVV